MNLENMLKCLKNNNNNNNKIKKNKKMRNDINQLKKIIMKDC